MAVAATIRTEGSSGQLGRADRDLGADEQADHVLARRQRLGALDLDAGMAGERAARRLGVADLVDEDHPRHGRRQDAGMWKVNIRSASIRAYIGETASRNSSSQLSP